MKFSPKWARSLAATAILLCCVAMGHAQDATSGSISGTVTDSTGAAVKGATVVVVNTDRNQVERTITTNSAGYYTATSLPLGTYSVKVTDAGFKTSTVTSLTLHVNDALTVNRALATGDATESITVTADEARVNLEDATQSGLINSVQLNEMPLATRNYATLINLMPGVAFSGTADANFVRGPSGISGSSSTVAFSVNGGRTTSNAWTVDGADNLDRGANLTVYVYPSPDAIAEFKVLRGQYSAEYGRNASGQVDVVTKSGSNTFHGSAYEFIRNDALDAAGYSNGFNHTKKAPYRYNDFGFSVGGYVPFLHIGQNKTFFFVSQEWLRQVSYAENVQGLVPQASERTGDFSNSGYKNASGTWTTGPIQVCTAYTTNPATQINTCTASGTQVTNISPTAAAYMKDVYNKLPVPDIAYNEAHGYDPHSIFTSFKNTYNNSDTAVRVDQQLGSKLTVFYRYMHDTFPEHLAQGQFTTSALPGTNVTDAKNPGTQHLAKGTYLFSQSLVMNAGYAFSNGNIVSTPSGSLGSSQSPDVNATLPYANTVGLIPNLAIAGMSPLSGSLAYIDHGTNHQAFGDITKTLKTLTLIAGFSYNHYQKLENNTTGTNGAFSFGIDAAYACPVVPTPGCVTTNTLAGAGEAQAFANFLTGNANSGFSQLSRDPVTDIKESLYEGFLQGNWKATPRLTVNLGVRYAYYGQPWDANLLMSNFDPSKYSAGAAPTVSSVGLLCFTAPCTQAGSNAGQPTTPNGNADYSGINYVNGMIFNGPNASNNNQASQFGKKVGTAQNNNYAPRFGFAYDVFGDGKTSLRGGYGWSFDNAEVSYYETTVFKNPPAVATYSLGQTSFDNPTGGSLTALTTTPGRIQAVPLNFQTPYVQQYSLGIQQQISPKTFLDIGYVGNRGTHLMGALALNQPKPGAFVGVVSPLNVAPAAPTTCLDTDTGTLGFISSTCDRVLNQIKPYLGYDAVDGLRTIFSSNYNALQVKFTKRFSGKSYIDVNYTWSRDLTNAQADYSGFIQNTSNINGDYGRAAVDRNNILTMDGVYELPWYRDQKGLTGRLIGGWELSTIYTIQSGLPLTPASTSATSAAYNLPGGAASVYNGRVNSGIVNDSAGLGLFGATSDGERPNQIGNPNSGNGVKIHNHNMNQLWFYTGAFASALPSQTTSAGSAKRGTIQGPGFNSAQLGIFRNFRIYNRLAFQFRAEAYNFVNHTNVSGVSVAVSNGGTFGQITGYREARIMQFGGKFTF